jgi:hypothetical protein
MTPAAVLAELHRRGATAYRKGDTIRLRPAAVLSPALVEAVRQHKAELLLALPETPQAAGEWLGVRICSRLLPDQPVWLVQTDADAATLEAELVAEGEPRPVVFTVGEVQPLATMLEADRRALLAALVRIKRAMPGATLEAVDVRGDAGEPS